jgi:hypothetical protein
MEALYLASLLTCSQAQWIAEGALLSSAMTWEEKVDVIREITKATEPGCEFDGYTQIDTNFFDESTR